MRRYDIDYIRVIAFALLILYHVGMFFVPWDFHIKNSVIYPEMKYPMLFLNQWRLHLLFIISGMGTCFALSKRTGWQFAKERFKRLFIPLIFGMLFIVPPQVYFERLDKGQFSGSFFFDYWPSQAYTVEYPGGNLSWHHLWFILYLFIFSLILIPVFLYLRKHPVSPFMDKLRSAVSGTGIYLFIIPLFFWHFFLEPRFPQTNGLIGDWYNLINYCTLFLFGFLLITVKDVFWKNVMNNRLKYLICGLIGYSVLLCLWNVFGSFPGKDVLFSLAKVFNMWSWILVVCGYAAQYLNKPGRFLSYSNEAVYPFYILHQTVIIALGYYLKNIDMSFFPKFSIMVAGTFGITWIIYEFGIRRYRFIRPLFGMKSKSRL